MSYRQSYTELEGQFTTVVGATVSGAAVNTGTLAAGANEIGTSEIGIGAVSGAAIGSASVGLPHLANASVSGLHIVAQGIGADRILNAAITATQLADASASGTKVSPGFAVVSSGSPAAVGRMIYGGTGATGAGSDAWVVYPGVTFAAAPLIIAGANATAITANTFFIPAGSITAGSFYVQSTVASTTFHYTAIGSGRSP